MVRVFPEVLEEQYCIGFTSPSRSLAGLVQSGEDSISRLKSSTTTCLILRYLRAFLGGFGGRRFRWHFTAWWSEGVPGCTLTSPEIILEDWRLIIRSKMWPDLWVFSFTCCWRPTESRRSLKAKYNDITINGCDRFQKPRKVFQKHCLSQPILFRRWWTIYIKQAHGWWSTRNVHVHVLEAGIVKRFC